MFTYVLTVVIFQALIVSDLTILGFVLCNFQEKMPLKAHNIINRMTHD